jgi:hypothetical protein
MTFEIGDRIIHKLTGQRMTILKLTDFLAILKKDIPEPFFILEIEYPGDKAICKLEYLKLE